MKLANSIFNLEGNYVGTLVDIKDEYGIVVVKHMINGEFQGYYRKKVWLGELDENEY